MRDVAIVGSSQTKFGKLAKSNVELFAEAGIDAINKSGIAAKDIEALFLGTVFSDFEEGQVNMGGFCAAEVGLGNVPATRFEGACASATVAVRDAAMWVASGQFDIVLAGGTERAFAMGTPFATRTFAMGGDAKYEAVTGNTFPGAFAMAARLYSKNYGIPLDKLMEMLASITIKNHKYGALNPLGQFYGKMGNLTTEKVLGAPKIAEPLGLFDCCPFSDGGSAIVITTGEIARELTDTPVYIVGTGQGSGGALFRQKDFTKPKSRVASAQMALKMAGLSPSDIDVIELHDCFTPAEAIAIEAMGFYDWGTAAKASDDGETMIDGKYPTNISGGLIGKGHPVGATGAAQVHAICEQLRGEMPQGLQVDGPEAGMTDTLGGDFGTIAHIVLSLSKRRK